MITIYTQDTRHAWGKPVIKGPSQINDVGKESDVLDVSLLFNKVLLMFNPFSGRTMLVVERTHNDDVVRNVVVVVFFTLTDRASTIPSNIRGCQSGTWSAGQIKRNIYKAPTRAKENITKRNRND